MYTCMVLPQTTKLLWCPERESITPTRDLLATTGDYLRIWNVAPGNPPKLEALLNNVGIRDSTCVTLSAALAIMMLLTHFENPD